MKTCPFCNAPIPVELLSAQTSRITCTRCGESFGEKTGVVAENHSPRQPGTKPVVKKSRFWTLIFLFSLPLVAAIIAYLLPTPDGKMPAPEFEDDVAPLYMKSLSYLPPKLDALIAFQNPAENLLLFEQLDVLNQPILNAVGLDLKEVQELVIGVRIDPLGLFAVIRTSGSTALEDRLRNQKYKITRERGRQFVELVGGKSFLNPVLSQPEPHTIIVALTLADAAEMPEKPGDLKTILRSEILAQLESLPRSASSWLVVQPTRLDMIKANLNLIPPLRPYAGRIELFDDLENLAAWQTTDLPGKIQVIVNLKSGAKGTRLRTLLSAVAPLDDLEILKNLGFEITPEKLSEWRARLSKK